MALEKLEATPLEIEAAGLTISGEDVGEGPPVVLLHGLTATRRYVVHGSLALPRSGFRMITYDARGHGESTPAPPGSGYGYAALREDLGRVIEGSGVSQPLLGGHSMGCHTAASYALEHPGEVAGMILIAPATLGLPPDEESLTGWDRLADGLERDGVEGFMRAYEADLNLDPDWRERVLRITRERLQRHRHPEAVAQALREVPRSVPFDGLAELESLDVPALVVASRDEADPGHPSGIAEAWAEALPQATLIGEEAGESPLAWQGGKLSRAIADWAERLEIRGRVTP
jgi:3-oxoadipate enol-lactonase